jgi:hypothetical protein
MYSNGGCKLKVEVVLRNPLDKADQIAYTIAVNETPMGHRWYQALQDVLQQELYLEKNFCFLGFPDSSRNLEYICQELEWAKNQINAFFHNRYCIQEDFTVDTLRTDLEPNQAIMNQLHNHFEHLQGTVWGLSDWYKEADYDTKFAIRQLNNLCHEAESLMLSHRKQATLPDWIRPSQITTFLNAERIDFPNNCKTTFDEVRYNRRFGEVYLHWTQIGKTLYEVYRDESGADIDKTVCDSITHLRYYSGEFDIEWAQDVVFDGPHPWHTREMTGFREWLIRNRFDLEDAEFNYGYHPVAQVELAKSFGTTDFRQIWPVLSRYLDIYSITAGPVTAVYDYAWTDADYRQQQIERLKPGYDYNSRR